ncbi:MAG: hypothetical protein HZA48_08630 [Planctomycetes bacterium]|nr:hypothetical protein [Planctomycetota bacterium]
MQLNRTIWFILGFCLMLSNTAIADGFQDGFEADLDSDNFPDNWRKTLDEIHPRYNEVSIDKTVAHSGNSSMRINVLGRSTQLISREYFLIEPNQTYIISGWVKMSGFVSDHAYISISWFDEMGTMVKRGKRSFFTAGDTGWVNLQIHLSQIPDGCKFIKIQCNLEGPDLSGTCWFDDIALQTRLILSIDSFNHPGNIFMEDEPVVFMLKAKNFKEGAYDLNYRILNHKGEPVIDWTAIKTTVKNNGFLEYNLTPSLNATGYYECETIVKDGAGNNVTEMKFGFGIVPDKTLSGIKSTSYSGNFGLVFDPYVSDTYVTPRIITETGIKKIKLILWSNSFTESQAAETDAYLKNLIPYLFSNGTEIIGVLGYPSPSLQRKLTDKPVTQTHMYNIFSMPQDIWAESFLTTLRQYREYIAMWQFGDDKDPSFTNITDFSDFISNLTEVSQIETKFLQIGIPIQESSLPDMGSLKIDPPLTFISLNMDKLKSPEDILSLKKSVSAQKVNTKYLTLRIGDAAKSPEMPGPSPLYSNYSKVEWQLVDLVKKAVYCAACGEFDAYFMTPYELIFDEQGMPTSAFYTLRTCSDILGSAKFVRSNLIEAENVRSYVFEKNNTGIIALWTDSDTEITRDIYLSKQALPQIGLTGEYALLPEGEKKTIHITRTPSFIIVPELDFLQTQLSIKLVPASIESKTAQQEIRVELTNMFDFPMDSVKMKLSLPQGWTVKNATGKMDSIPPLETRTFSFYVQMPVYETQNIIDAEIGLEFDVISASDNETKSLYAKVYRSLVVIPQIEAAHFVEKAMNGKGLDFRLEIRNNTKDMLSLRCYIAAQGIPPFENSVTGLAPDSKKDIHFLIPDKGIKEYKLFIKDTGGSYFTARKIIIP